MRVIYQDIYTPCFLVCKCGIYHLCHIFTLWFLHICNIFVTYLLGANYILYKSTFSYSGTYLGTCTCLLVFNVCMPDIIQGASRWLCRTIVLFKSVSKTIELYIPHSPSPNCVCATNICAPVVSLIQLLQV